MTQKQLCKASGVSQATISELETGESKTPTGVNLVALANALTVRPEWLAAGEEPMEDDLPPPLPPTAVRVARDWLKLKAPVRKSIAAHIHALAEATVDKEVKQAESTKDEEQVQENPD